MKLEFDDKSYLEIIQDKKELTIILCGNKCKNQLTVSSVKLSAEQVKEMLSFLSQFDKFLQ